MKQNGNVPLSLHWAERLAQLFVITRRSGLADSGINEVVERPALCMRWLENFSEADIRQLLQAQVG